MRLLNKETLELEWFVGEECPNYLILSHQWRGAETSLQEFEAQKHLPSKKWSAGTAKVMRFCEAVKDRLEKYVWVDTCCIDKTSSAELQEAINSMFRWYRLASLCYVFLDDVNRDALSESATRIQIRQSRCFTRGWTLQELIAPLDMLFVDSSWCLIGSRDQLAPLLERTTGIERACLGNRRAVFETPVVKRMSWMSQRQTSRVENLAYCMLGIFDIHMPLLYGESWAAYARLQKEIILQIEDESIFLWQDDQYLHSGAQIQLSNPRRSVLARRPVQFFPCRYIDIRLDRKFDREPCRITTRGLEIETSGIRSARFLTESFVVLNCTVDGKRACMRIHRMDGHGPDDWERAHSGSIDTLDEYKYSVPLSAWQEWQIFEYNKLHGDEARKRDSESRRSLSDDWSQFNEQVKWKLYIRQ